MKYLVRYLLITVPCLFLFIGHVHALDSVVYPNNTYKEAHNVYFYNCKSANNCWHPISSMVKYSDLFKYDLSDTVLTTANGSGIQVTFATDNSFVKDNYYTISVLVSANAFPTASTTNNLHVGVGTSPEFAYEHYIKADSLNTSPVSIDMIINNSMVCWASTSSVLSYTFKSPDTGNFISLRMSTQSTVTGDWELIGYTVMSHGAKAPSTDDIQNAIAPQFQELNVTISNLGNNMVAITDELGNTIVTSNDEVKDTINMLGSDLDATISDLGNNMVAITDNLGHTIVTSNQVLQYSIDQMQSDMSNGLNNVDSSINDMSNQMSTDINNMNTNINNGLNNVDGSINDMSNQMSTDINNMNTNINNGLNNVDSSINDMSNQMSTDINNMKNDIDNSINSDDEDTSSSKCGIVCKLKGIFTGIKNLPSYIWNALKGGFEAITNGLTSLFDGIKNLFTPPEECTTPINLFDLDYFMSTVTKYRVYKLDNGFKIDFGSFSFPILDGLSTDKTYTISFDYSSWSSSGKIDFEMLLLRPNNTTERFLDVNTVSNSTVHYSYTFTGSTSIKLYSNYGIIQFENFKIVEGTTTEEVCTKKESFFSWFANFFKNIINGILSLPKTIISLLIDALKSLFVPTDEQLYDIINESKELTENFGFVGEAINFFLTIFTSLLGLVNANGCIELPEFTIGETTLFDAHTFWEKQNVCLGDNAILSSNITTIRTITSIALVCLFINFAASKFFSILNKNDSAQASVDAFAVTMGV